MLHLSLAHRQKPSQAQVPPPTNHLKDLNPRLARARAPKRANDFYANPRERQTIVERRRHSDSLSSSGSPKGCNKSTLHPTNLPMQVSERQPQPWIIPPLRHFCSDQASHDVLWIA